jgi:hypothetical protein
MEKIDWSEFTLQVGDTMAIIPCLSFVLYLDVTDQDGILDFYQQSLKALGERITHYQTDSMDIRAPLTSRAQTIVPTWLKNPREGKLYWIKFHGCAAENGINGNTFELMFKHFPCPDVSSEKLAQQYEQLKKIYTKHRAAPVTMLRVTLPVNHPLADPEQLRAWVLNFQLVKGWPFLFGYCGYALNYLEEEGEYAVRQHMDRGLRSLCLRHPGFDWHGTGIVDRELLYYDTDSDILIPKIKRVSWLTLLSQRTVHHLGGQEKIRSAIAANPQIKLFELKHGLVIQAGSTPQLGDIGNRDFISAYREIAKILRPARIEKMDGPDGVEEEWVDEWLDAFDKTYD